MAQHKEGGDGGADGGTNSGDSGDSPIGWGSIVAGTAVVAVAYLLSRSGDDGRTTTQSVLSGGSD